jgi:hypothetical protein
MQDCSEGRRSVGAPSFTRTKKLLGQRNDELSGYLVGVALKWLRLGNKSQIDLDVFSRRYAAGLLMRTTR